MNYHTDKSVIEHTNLVRGMWAAPREEETTQPDTT